MNLKIMKKKKENEKRTRICCGEGFKIEMTYGMTLSTAPIQFSTIFFSFPMQSQSWVHKTKKVKTFGTYILE